MKLIWKEMVWDPMWRIYVERWFIDGRIGIASCILALPLSFLLCVWLFG